MAKNRNPTPLKIDMRWAQQLRDKLLAYRFRQFEKRPETSDSTEILNNYGRVGEIFYGVLEKAPNDKIRKTLTELALNLYDEQKEDEATSLEADVVRSILAHQKEAENNRLGWRLILADLNLQRDKDEKLTEKNIGWVGKRLHLKKGRLSDGKRAIVLNDKLLKQLSITYDIGSPPQGTSKRQNVRKKALFSLRKFNPDVSRNLKNEIRETSDITTPLSRPDVSDNLTFSVGTQDGVTGSTNPAAEIKVTVSSQLTPGRTRDLTQKIVRAFQDAVNRDHQLYLTPPTIIYRTGESFESLEDVKQVLARMEKDRILFQKSPDYYGLVK